MLAGRNVRVQCCLGTIVVTGGAETSHHSSGPCVLSSEHGKVGLPGFTSRFSTSNQMSALLLHVLAQPSVIVKRGTPLISFLR